MDVGEQTLATLMEYAESIGKLDLSAPEARQRSVPRIIHMLQMIVASKEYQFA